MAAVTTSEDGSYLVSTATGRIVADNVVIATGTFGRTPLVPSFADQLDPSILQLHSSEYRRPSDLLPGPVLVVGASHSGCDLAYEIAESHPTILVGRDTGQIPVRFDSPFLKLAYPIMLFAFGHVLSRRNPLGRKRLEEFRLHGGPRLRVQERDLADRGVDWVKGRVTAVVDGKPVVNDTNGTNGSDGARELDVATVVWCTGFKQVFGWVDVPVFGDDGWPREHLGVVPEAPGLYFAGLGFQSSALSMLVHGAGRDSAHVAAHLLKRTAALISRTHTEPQQREPSAA